MAGPAQSLVQEAEISRYIRRAWKDRKDAPRKTLKEPRAAQLTLAYQQSRKICRIASPDMMEVLVGLARDDEVEPRVRSVCAMAVLDRAGVKPIDYDPAEEKRAAPKFNAKDFSNDELEQIEAVLRMITERNAQKAAERGQASAVNEDTGEPIDAEVLDP